MPCGSWSPMVSRTGEKVQLLCNWFGLFRMIRPDWNCMNADWDTQYRNAYETLMDQQPLTKKRDKIPHLYVLWTMRTKKGFSSSHYKIRSFFLVNKSVGERSSVMWSGDSWLSPIRQIAVPDSGIWTRDRNFFCKLRRLWLCLFETGLISSP